MDCRRPAVSERPRKRKEKRYLGFERTSGYPDRTLEKLIDPEVRRRLNAIRHGLSTTGTALNHQAASPVPAPRKIELPPAHLLVVISKWLLNDEAYRRYVEPHVLDMRLEYYKAIAAGRRIQARWIVLRGYWDVLTPLRRGLWITITRWLVEGYG
jgi:hypothetical protein